MKILHTISSLNVNAGGPSQSVFYTVKGLRQYGVDATILTYQTKGMISDDIFITALPAVHTKFSYSRAYMMQVESFNGDIIHAQALWQYPTYIAAKMAKKKGKALIITPRGMLYPQALKKSAWKKRIMLTCLKRDLNRASAVHATCMEEMRHLRHLGIHSPIAVIPNPINIQNNSLLTTHYGQLTAVNSQFRIGYLGRIHPRKNIERIIYAWYHLGNKVDECELVIIGGGEDVYEQFLKNEVKRLNIRNVVFTGFLSGEEKDKAMESLSFLVVPSDFENFGMVIPEALVKGIPVIASKGTPWEELNTHRCGWWVDNDVDTLSATIETAINTSESMRREMGENGRKLVMDNYSVEVVAKKMIRLYKWIIEGGEKPEFVYI